MAPAAQTILILTPVKNATSHLDAYFAGLDRLSYPPSLISLGFLESDSDDATYERIRERIEPLHCRYASVAVWQKHFNFHIRPGLPRWTHALQIPRRKILAKARNHLLFRALKDQDWVLWLDVDVIEYPPDLIERLISAGRDIVHPHCVKRYGGPSYDLNAWRDHGRVHLDDLRGGPDLVRLDTVGGTVLLVRADVHRDGLIFPCFPYGAANPAVRRPGPLALGGELETEGFGIMAQDMGYQCWGMPNLEVLHALV
jgi:peptide chain release factor subunit 1